MNDFDDEGEYKGYKPKKKKWGGPNAKKKAPVPFYKREFDYDAKRLTTYALNKLSKQDFGRVELFKKMSLYQKDHSIINEVLDKLENLGYLSDARRINSVLNQFSNTESIKKTSQRLAMKGFTKEQIKEVVTEREDNEQVQDEELPVNLLLRKFRSTNWQNMEFDEKRKLQDKMTRFLVSRGFGFDVIKDAMKEFFTQTENNNE